MTHVALLIVTLAAFRRGGAGRPKIKPSQHGTVAQRIADTTVTLEYNRPVARGRELFGTLVPYGKIWCPCADDATTIELTTAVKIAGRDLAAGSIRSGRCQTQISGPSSSIAAPTRGTRSIRKVRMRCAWR